MKKIAFLLAIAFGLSSFGATVVVDSTGGLTYPTNFMQRHLVGTNGITVTPISSNRVLISFSGSSGLTINSSTATNLYNAGYHDFNDAGGGNFNIGHPDGSIATNKLQSIPAQTILGNPSGSAASPSTYTLGSGLSIVGGALTASGGGGSTNASSVTINGSANMPVVNMKNATNIGVLADSGTNALWYVIDDSIGLQQTSAALESYLLSRANHTGTQTASTISDLTSAIWVKITNSLVASNNVSIAYDESNQKLMLLASTGTTNSGTSVTVNGGAGNTVLNITNSPTVNASQVSTNLSFSVNDSSITTNKLDSTAYAELMRTNFSDLSVDTLSLLNRLTTNHLKVQDAPRLIGRVRNSTNIAEEIQLGIGLTSETSLPSVRVDLGDGTNTVVTTNGSGKLAVNVYGISGGGSSNTLSVNGSANLPVLNIQDGPNTAWTLLSSTNAQVEFTGVGSNTNGYYSRSSSYVSVVNTNVETDVYSWTIPGGTLTANGDELLFYIPGKYLEYVGQTTGYGWSFYIDANEVSPSSVSGSYPNAFASVSSSFATMWQARVRRIDASTASMIVEHYTGADNSSDSTNLVTTIRYLSPDHTLAADWASDVTFKLTFTPSVANLNHGLTAFGYTVVKVGSQGTGIADGAVSGSDIPYAMMGPGSSVTQYKTVVWADTTGTNATEAALVFSGGSSRSNATLAGVFTVDTVRVNANQTNYGYLGVAGGLNTGSTNVEKALSDLNSAVSGLSNRVTSVNGTNAASLNLTNNVFGDWVVTAGTNVEFVLRFNQSHGAVWSDGYQQGGSSSANSLNPFGGVAIASGTVGQQGGETNHPGIVRATSASGANSGYYFGTGTSDVTMDAPWGFCYVFRIVQTNDLRFYMGGMDSTSTSLPTDGWYFDNQYGWLVGASAVGGVYSYTTTSNQLSTNVWYTAIGYIPDRTQAKLLLFDSDTGANIVNHTISSPGAMANVTNRFGWGITQFRNAGTATPMLDIDFMGVMPVGKVQR